MTTKTTFFAATLTCAILALSSGNSLAWKGMGAQGMGGHGSMPASHGNGTTPLKDMSQMGHKESRQQVVALVNGSEITMGRLMDSMRELVMSKYGRQQITKELARRIRIETLEKLVMEELACQQAAKLGITPDQELIAKKMAAVKKSAGGEKAFQEELDKKNKTEKDIEREITNFVIIKEVIDKEVNQNIEISQEEIDKTYQANREQFVTPERVVVTDIIFFLDPDLPESREKVEKIRARVINELDNDPTRLQADGFIISSGIDVSAEYKPEHYKAAKAMDIGELSRPLIFDSTWHLLKFDQYQPRSEKSEEEAKKLVANKLKSMKKQQLLAQWRQELVKDADIEIVHDLLKGN